MYTHRFTYVLPRSMSYGGKLQTATVLALAERIGPDRFNIEIISSTPKELVLNHNTRPLTQRADLHRAAFAAILKHERMLEMESICLFGNSGPLNPQP